MSEGDSDDDEGNYKITPLYLNSNKDMRNKRKKKEEDRRKFSYDYTDYFLSKSYLVVTPKSEKSEKDLSTKGPI